MIRRLLLWLLMVSLATAVGWWGIGVTMPIDSAGVARFWLVVLAGFMAMAGAAGLAGQLRFFLRRAAQLPVILIVIYLITFALVWVAPGDPFQQTDKAQSMAVAERLRRDFHAESWRSFLAYYPLHVLASGDFGPSMTNPRATVNDILRTSLPVSVELGLIALLIAIVVGVTIGSLAAVARDGPLDWFSVMVALAGISVPSFVAASLLVAVFSVWLGWVPSNGWRAGTIGDMILPAISLSLLPMAYITRLTRVSMIDVLSSDFVRTARAKGLARSTVVWKHGLRNAMLPVVSYIGPAAATTLVGSFVVEKVFNIPGLGQFFVTSVQNRDQTLILGTVIVEAAILLALNLLVDLAYGLFDPRIEVDA